MLYHCVPDEVGRGRSASIPDMEALGSDGCLGVGVSQHDEQAHGVAHDGQELHSRWALQGNVPTLWSQLLQLGQQLLDEPRKLVMDQGVQRKRQVQLPEGDVQVQLALKESFLQAQYGDWDKLVPHWQRLQALHLISSRISSIADQCCQIDLWRPSSWS